MSGDLAYNAAFMYAATMPIPVQRSRTRRSTSAQQQPRRSNSTSRADYPGARRALGHSRTSSGSQASRSSHETTQTTQTAATSLQTDRPATTSAAAAVGQNPAGAADSPIRAVHGLASAKSPSSMHRPHPPRFDDDLHGFDVSISSLPPLMPVPGSQLRPRSPSPR